MCAFDQSVGGAVCSMLKIKAAQSLSNTKSYKVLVLGSAAAGKSILVHRAVVGKVPEVDYAPSLGVELVVRDETFDNEKTSLQLWTCAGNGVLLVYDMTNEASFKELIFWYNECKRACADATLILVGTKSDLTAAIKVTSDDGNKQAKEWGVLHAVVSAKTGQNVDQLFTTLLATMKKSN